MSFPSTPISLRHYMSGSCLKPAFHGTLSGPKNFLVQINDLQTPCPMFKYVDDSTVFDVCNNSSVPMLQESADIITDWSRNNDMRINATKTKEMVICFCRNDNHEACVYNLPIEARWYQTM